MFSDDAASPVSDAVAFWWLRFVGVSVEAAREQLRRWCQPQPKCVAPIARLRWITFASSPSFRSM